MAGCKLAYNSEVPKAPAPARLALLDGHSLIHRAWHAIKEPLVVRHTGEETTAVFGFTNTLLKVIDDLKPTYVAVAMDYPAPTFRHKADQQYKATRPRTPPELRKQIARVRDIIDAFNIPIYEAEGYEADDVLGALARQGKESAEVYLCTLDTDIAQLVEPGVKLFMYRLYQRDTVMYDVDAVRERWGFEPIQMADFKAIKGDVSDNIPSIPGIGDKTATKLVQEFGSVEAMLDRIDEVQPEKVRDRIAEYADQIRNSKALATIERDVPVELDPEAARLGDYDRERVLELFRELEFRSLVPRLPEASRPAPTVQRNDGIELDYASITSEADLVELVARAREQGEFSLECEAWFPEQTTSPCVGFAIALEPGYARYVPIGHRQELGDAEQLSIDVVRRHLGPLLEDAGVAKVAHNGKNDIVLLANQLGIELKGLSFDTMVAAYLLGEGSSANRPAEGGLSLHWLVSSRLGREMEPRSDLVGSGVKAQPAATFSYAQCAPYACADADYALRLRPLLEADMGTHSLASLFREIEMPLVAVLARLELVGVAVETAALRDMSQVLTGEIARLEKEIFDIAGHEFTLGSPQQLGRVLFEDLRLPKTRKTKQGYSTDAQALETLRQQLVAQTGEVHPILDLIQEHRHLSKLKSTYLDTLPGLISPKDGRLHTTFSQVTAATGRLSSNEPNLQNIPIRTEIGGQIRRAFIARDFGPEPILLAADYSQIELRIMAHVCQDEALLEAFLNDEDIHAATASRVWGMPIDEVPPELRRRAKVFNFGVLYGLSDFGLSAREGISRAEAAEFIAAYFTKFSSIKAWQENIISETRTRGYTETLLGRRRYIPEITSSNFNVRRAGERMAINMPIQGTAADVIKIAMNRVDERLGASSLTTRMTLQVHDELLFEGPEAEVEELSNMLFEIMPASMALSVPLKVDIKLGRSWGEMRPFAAAVGAPAGAEIGARA
ncbi:MAG: DNA polymerase I [Dehalococcoidia bacterium]|nr:DNA polymerase I [Dehalococcoidia bacterium]